MEDIIVLHGDTAVVPRGIGTFGSRSVPVGGAAVLESSVSVREGAKEIAAHLLEAAAPDIALEDGRFHVVGVPGRSVSWREVAAFGNSEKAQAPLRKKLAAETDFRPKRETIPSARTSRSSRSTSRPEKSGSCGFSRWTTVARC